MVTSVIPLRSNAIATHNPDMPAPTTATAGSRLVMAGAADLPLPGLCAPLEALQGQLDVLGIGGRPIGDAGGPGGELAEPAGPPVPGALGDLAAAVGRCQVSDVVLPARYRNDGVPHIECEDATRFGGGDGALRGPPVAAVFVAPDEHR